MCQQLRRQQRSKHSGDYPIQQPQAAMPARIGITIAE